MTVPRHFCAMDDNDSEGEQLCQRVQNQLQTTIRTSSLIMVVNCNELLKLLFIKFSSSNEMISLLCTAQLLFANCNRITDSVCSNDAAVASANILLASNELLSLFCC